MPYFLQELVCVFNMALRDKMNLVQPRDPSVEYLVHKAFISNN